MKKFILLAGILLLAAACAEDKSNDTGTNSYQVTGKVIYTADNFKSAKICVDANNNGLADDAYCTETANDGSYSFTSNNSTNNYPLVASITTNAKINNGSILMYAPKGKADVISIETTLIKSIMEQNSTKTYDMANTEVTALIKKADNKTLFTVYTNALNNADIQNWETSIRGIVGAVTNKLLESTEITADTIITVTQEEVDNINNIIKEEDNKEPENPGTEPATPLEKVTEILAGAEIKNSAESPVNLNEHVDPALNSYNPMTKIYELGIKSDAFGEFSTETFASQMSMAGQIGYAENGWPSDKQGFEVFPNEEDKTGYTFTNFHSSAFEHSDACKAGKVNGITYKPVIEEAVNNNIQTSMQECVKNSGIEMSSGGQFNPDDMDKMMKCYADSYYQYKDSIKIEKWYWTIDTTQIDVCKNGSSSNITAF